MLVRSTPIRYWWFPPEVVAELGKQIREAGEGAILKVVPHDAGLLLHVIPAGETEEASASAPRFKPLNHSNECPPYC